MKLPNAEHAIIEREKVADYLLNSGHPDNGGKAPFFVGYGFHPDAWDVFTGALRSLAMTGEITKSLDSPHGMKYISRWRDRNTRRSPGLVTNHLDS